MKMYVWNVPLSPPPFHISKYATGRYRRGWVRADDDEES